MTGTKTAARDLTGEIAYLTRALKAPTLRESAGRLAERARAESWTHEEYLAACLQREVAARDAHGGEDRIRAARFPARKSIEEFDFDHARGLKRDLVAHLANSTRCPAWQPRIASVGGYRAAGALAQPREPRQLRIGGDIRRERGRDGRQVGFGRRAQQQVGGS